MPVITNSASELSEISWMVKSTGNQKDLDEKLMNDAFTTMSGTPSKPKLVNKMPSGIFSLENPYKGMLFIAYRPNASATISAMKEHVKGTAPTEQDIYRNLNYSNNVGNINGSAQSLVD